MSYGEAANSNDWMKGCLEGFTMSERFKNKKILYLKQVCLVNF